MRQKWMLATAVISLTLTACSANQDVAPKPADNNAPKDSIAQVEHMHGIAYSGDGSALYAASHEGLLSSKDGGKSWGKVGQEHLDLMGFHAMPNGTFITSGHPGQGSKYPNPLGFMQSTDQGQTWKPVSMAGKIDFHILAPNPKQPNVIYGLNQMGEGQYGAGIYKSIDGGAKWEQIKPLGLPADLDKVISMISPAADPNLLLAGVDGAGLMKSDDGGKTWKPINNKQLLTAMQTVPNEERIIGYVFESDGNGIVSSQDGGKTWTKTGFNLGQDDAVAYFAVNPQNPKEMAAASFKNSILLSKDGGKTWDKIMDKEPAK